MRKLYTLLFPVLFILPVFVAAQQEIVWQKSIGTPSGDTSVKLFKDRSGNLVVLGLEPHEDFTGNFRQYLVLVKMDQDGNELWKQYHDVAFNTFSPPLDYSIGDHFFTDEFGEQLINLVVSINNRTMLYKIVESTGDFYYAEDIVSPIIDVKQNNDRVYALTQCSYQLACYGPDSLIVQKFDTTPDSFIFNPIKWTFEMKQNIRTTPIQGHYDFDLQEIREDSAGNVYLLVQIERWDFQFCTDCNDAFIDAWCEVFRFSPEGELVKHKRIVTSRAVVSTMRFVSFSEDEMLVRVDDINASNTALISSLYHVTPDLEVTKTVKLDRQYQFIEQGTDQKLYTFTNIYDPTNPDLYGESDVLVSVFNEEGVRQWKKNYGGSGFEWPRGFVTVDNNEIVFLANTYSADFDVAENLGDQDMWLVRLGENTTGEKPVSDFKTIAIYPNPAGDYIYIHGLTGNADIQVIDMHGRVVTSFLQINVQEFLDINSLSAGIYVIRATQASEVFIGQFIKR